MGDSIFTNPNRSEQTCVRCNMGVFFIKYPYATGMGHIYSQDGIAEFFITQMCEWCFDEVCDEDIIRQKEANNRE